MTNDVQPEGHRPHVRHNRDGMPAALYAGPALTISFVLAAIACGLVGLCYVELSTLLPVQGSTYT